MVIVFVCFGSDVVLMIFIPSVGSMLSMPESGDFTLTEEYETDGEEGSDP